LRRTFCLPFLSSSTPWRLLGELEACRLRRFAAPALSTPRYRSAFGNASAPAATTWTTMMSKLEFSTLRRATSSATASQRRWRRSSRSAMTSKSSSAPTRTRRSRSSRRIRPRWLSIPQVFFLQNIRRLFVSRRSRSSRRTRSISSSSSAHARSIQNSSARG
ncbi:hypothetical protein HDK77DRAFT_512635, partial [Phyllosticta capitalensis]